MFKSKFTRLKLIAILACDTFYSIHKINIELSKVVASEFKTIMQAKD